MADQFAPDQLPTQEPAAADPPAKRAKFLSKFAALDPDADLNEESLGSILNDPEKRDEFTKYVNQLNPDFTMNGQELADALGYNADVKKKLGGDVSSTGSQNTLSAPNGSTGVDVAQMQAALGVNPVDVSTQAAAPADQQFAATPEAGALGYQLPGAPAPTAEQATRTELEAAVPFAPGTQSNPLYLGAPGSYAPDQLGADATQLVEQRGPMPLPSTGDSPRNEQELLDAFPAVPPGKDYPNGFNLEDEADLVAIPPNYQGGTPTGTQVDPATGLRYFRRALSNKVDGKEQSRAEAFGTSFLNASKEILQGAGEGLQAVGNLALSGTNPATIAAQAANPLTFGDEFSEALEKGKGAIAPLYTAPHRQNLNTVTVQAGAFAPMILAQVAQTLAPETRLPGLLKAAVGLAGTVAFDAPIIHGARERAKAAGLQGTAAEAYTVFESALTLGAFKMGGKLLGQAGDAAVLKAAPKEFSEGVALDAAKRVGAMEQQLGRALTTGEQQAALSQSLAAALPRLAKLAKGTLQQGALMPLAGTATTIGNQVGARALGGTAEEITPESFLQDRGRDVGAGLLMGGVTEGVAAGLDAAGAMIRRPATAAEQAPVQADPDTAYYVTGDFTNTSEGSIADARILGPGATPGTVRVRGLDIDNNPVEHDVAQSRLAPQAELDAMQAEEDAQQPAAEATAAEPALDPVLVAAPEGAPTPFPTDREAAIERLNRMQQRLAEIKGQQASAQEAPPTEPELPVNEPAQVAPTPPSTPEPEPSPIEAAATPASPPDAVGGPVSAADEAATVNTPDGAINAIGAGIKSANEREFIDDLEQSGKAYRRKRNPNETDAQWAEALNERKVVAQQMEAVTGKKLVAEVGKGILGSDIVYITEAKDVAADEAPTAPSPEPLAEATPDPAQVKKLTPQQQATNNTLDALDRYNALKPGQKKGKEGSTARAEIARAAKKANIDVLVDKDGKVTLAGGKRLTRSNEYTATTPAANHVPLEGRPEEAQAFMEALLFTGDQNNPSELQGLGIKIRGKELSGRELSDAVKDIRAGRNTLRAQLVLDALENAHRRGYVEKSTGTGLATRKFQVPIEDYMGDASAAMEAGERGLTDQEWDDALSADPNLAEAIASYTDPTTSDIDYASLATDGGRGALETFFDVPTEIATKITALANERAQQTTASPADEATALAGSTTEGSPQPSEPATPSPGPAAAAEEVASKNQAELESKIARQAASHKNRLGDFERQNSKVLEDIAHARQWDATSTHWGAATRVFNEAMEHFQRKVRIYLRDSKKLPFEKQPEAGSDKWVKLVEDSPLSTEWQEAQDSLKKIQAEQKIIADRYANTPEAQSLRTAHFGPNGIEEQHKALKSNVSYSEAGYDIGEPEPNDSGSISSTSLTDTVVGQSETSPLEQQAAANRASIERLKNLSGDLWTALGKQTGKAGSIGGGLHPDVARILKEMIRESIKLGVGTSKQAIARIRAADSRLTADVLTDEQIKAIAIETLKEEGKFRPKSGSRQAPDNPADATGERAHAKRYNQATQDSLTSDERNYVPAAVKIAANEKPAAFIKRVGADAAYEQAIGDKPGDVDALLHDNLIRGVADHYTAERNAALLAGNTEAADAAQERLMRLVGALAKTGTAQAQAMQARVGAGGTIGDLLSAKDPAATGQATVNEAFGEIANRNVENQQQNDKDGAEVTTQAKTKRQRKMADVLATDAVQAAINNAGGTTTPAPEAAPTDAPKYGESNKYFTKQKIAEWRKQLKGMAFSTPLPTQAILIGAYHLEASARKFTDWSAKMVREAGVKIRPRLAELYELSKAELLKNDPQASGFNTPDEAATIVGLQQVPGAVRDGVKDLGKRLTDIAKQHASDIEADRRTLTDKFIQDAGLSGPAAKAVADAIEKEWGKRVEKAAWQSLRGRFQPKRTRAKLDALNRLTNDLNAAANLPASTMRSPVAQLLERLIGNNVPVSAAEAQQIEALKDAYIQAAKKTTRTIGGKQVEVQDTNAVAKAAVKLLAAIGKLKNVDQQDWTRDAGAMFYASLLSSPNTHLANAYLNGLATVHEVGVISTLHTWADTGSIRYAGEIIGALFPGYKQGTADAAQTVATGIDVRSKVGNSLSDKDYETDPLEERSFGRRWALNALQAVGIAKGVSAPEHSSLAYVKRALGASDTFFQGGFAESRAKEIAIKAAVQQVRQRRAAGETMSGQQVRDYVSDTVDEMLFNTKQAQADITAILDAEGLTGKGGVAEWSARQARIGDLLNQARASQHPEMVADSREFAARHAGNSEYEGHLGRFAKGIADTFSAFPAVGKLIVPFSRVTSNFQNRYAEWAGLGIYRAVRGGAGKPIFSKSDSKSKPFERDYTPEEREKAFLRSTIGVLSAMTVASLTKAGYVYVTGLPTGNKDEDQQRPAQSVGFTDKAPESLRGLALTYKGMPEEIALTTVAGTIQWAQKKELAGDDPAVSQRLAMAGVIGAASTMNLGPSNGAGDFLGAMSGVTTNPERTKRALLKLPRTAIKSVVQPAGVAFAFQLFNKAIDTNLPAKQSNEFFEQLQLDLFGDVPYWRGGAEDAVDVWGDPMKVETNRFYGVAPVSADPDKQAMKRRLVDLGAMPDEPRITDANLRLYNVKTGKGTSPLSKEEFHDYVEARGRLLWRSIYKSPRTTRMLLSGKPTEALDELKLLVKEANEDAKEIILSQRVKKGARVQFGHVQR